ncbi:response regulator [Spirochaetia bacterium 38H-sp]|uniref:Response regulator n=1 Tax=Rarispira pelagica TaxID=3141764 RepID=A0ABU9UBI3_9SPIR
MALDGGTEKKILIVDESEQFREYLEKKLGEYGFEIISTANGLDALVKMRNELPDLVIADYFMSRMDPDEFINQKMQHPNTKNIPLILTSNQMEKTTIVKLAKAGIRKVFTKPVKIDALLKAISELLGVKVILDDTPCIIEAHVNEGIIFIEIAQGLNKEKIELLRYKLEELLSLYKIKIPRVLVLMSSLDVTGDDSIKLATLFNIIMEVTRTKQRLVKVLTNNSFIKDYLARNENFNKIEVAESLDKIMDSLLGEKADEFIDKDTQTVQENFLASSHTDTGKEEKFHMRFDSERVEDTGNELDNYQKALSNIGKKLVFCVVDDDIVIQNIVKKVFGNTGIDVKAYNNGREFLVDSQAISSCNLLFLDLLMPEMDGFTTLEMLKKTGVDFPIIILSALSKKETVIKTLQYGVKSYLVKPLKPDRLLRKTIEVIKSSF